VAHGGLRPERLTLTPEEMDFLNSRRVTRDEILAVFGVPAAIAGISEDVNRASADALERIFSRNTIAPKLALIAQQIEQDLLPMYPADLRCEFDAAGPEDREQTRRDATAAFDRGALSVDELRQMLTGRPPLKRP
jgi:phage portal protein BeeE